MTETVLYEPGNPEADRKRFDRIIDRIYDRAKIRQGIGTLSEKTIHEVVKNFYCDQALFQEVKTGRYVADIACGERIIEIQNGNFYKLRGKLDAFLPSHEVTVVYPIPALKKVYWLDPETGELSAGHKSPRHGTVYDAFAQLYRIRHFLTDPHLHFAFLLIDMDEYRLLNGWSHDRKRGSDRYERLPVQLREIVTVESVRDYLQFFPITLPEQFTSGDLSRCAGISLSAAQTCILICRDFSLVREIGKKGRSNLYEMGKES